MKCVNHQEREAEAQCTVCHRPLCSECTATLQGQAYCRDCLKQQLEQTRPLQPPPSSAKSSFLALLCSLLPGAGYMYLGLMNRGVQVMIAFFGVIFIISLLDFPMLSALVLPVIFCYSVFDTMQLSGKIRDGLVVDDQPLVDLSDRSRQGLLGWLLIIAGGLALLNNYLPDLYGYYPLRRLIAPLVVIAVGLYLLLRERGQVKDE